VDARGQAKLLRRSEVDLIVRYGSQVVSTRIAALIKPRPEIRLRQEDAPQLHRRSTLQAVGVAVESASQPSRQRCRLPPPGLARPDGRAASPDRVREFLKDTDPEKKAKLIDSLIASRDFTRFWQIKFGDMLEITTARPDLGNVPAINYQTWLAKKLLGNAP